MKKLIILLVLIVSGVYIFAQRTDDYKVVDRYKGNNHFSTKTMQTASLLMDKYDVKFYKIDLNVERNYVNISGNTTIKAKVVAAVLDTFAFELNPNLAIDSIKINGLSRSFNRIGNETFVGINPLTINTYITAQVFYRTNSQNLLKNDIGIYCDNCFNNSNDSATFTITEPFYAYGWFPVKQSLKDKADSAYIFITTSNENKVGSNGLLTAAIPLANNKVRYEWKTHYPIAYYLLSFAVSKYSEYSFYAHPVGLQDSILIQNYYYENLDSLQQMYFKENSLKTKGILEKFSELYGIYPFWKEKYGHTIAPFGGGMEHQTMTTLGGVSFGLVAHELSHQWWGDNVTCATWSDIWINEGFASYSEYLAEEFLHSKGRADTLMFYMHSDAFNPNGSVYVPILQAFDGNRIFDHSLSYAKGAAIIHTLRFEINNDTIFFNILKQAQIRFKDSIMTGMDFKSVAEQISGISLNNFFNQWYFGEGYPKYDIIWYKYGDTLYTQIYQSTTTTVTPLFKGNVEIKIKTNIGDTIVRYFQSQNIQTFKFTTNNQIIGLEIDPNNWILNRVGTIMQGISENCDIFFKIFPNPCNDFLEIYMANNVSKNYLIAVFDITGKEIIRNQNFTTDNFSEINISNLEKGIYFLHISDGINKTVQKFIKQ